MKGSRGSRENEAPRGGVLARGYAAIVSGPLAFLILLAWIAVTALAITYLPSFSSAQGGLADLTPRDAPAIKAEQQAAALFQVPVLSRVAVVQRRSAGLSQAVRQQAVMAAVNLDRRVTPPPPGLLGAFPLVDGPTVLPGVREQNTTAITYLFFGPSLDWSSQARLAHRYAATNLNQPGASLVGVTGSIPARLTQEDQITSKLPYVEIATVVVIALIVGIAFGSVVAPIVTLFAGVVAYVVALRVVAWAGMRYGFVPPAELEPLVVVLLLGIVTDYAIFFLSGMRSRLEAGEGRSQAARATTAQFTPIIVTAGLMVAAGTAALSVATQRFFRSFGPGMAITVLVGLLVAVTLLPALLATFGRGLFWPRRPRSAVDAAGARDESLAGDDDESPALRKGSTLRYRIGHLATHRAAALLVSLLCFAALIAAASGLRVTHLGLDFVTSLPRASEVRRAAAAAGSGFAAGIVSPTEVIVQRSGIGGQRTGLARLEEAIARQPGVASVIGPREQPADPRLAIATSKDGNAARYVVVFSADPLGSAGIARYDQLRRAMPALLSQAGLRGLAVTYAGDTALAQYTVQRTLSDLVRIAIAVCVIDLVLLMIFLRSLFAPFYLLAASVLALAATLGVTTYLFQIVLGGEDLTYYVPFAASVLLVSLGSDYNVFLVGRIWEERRVRPLRSAIETAVPRARRAISAAALALAASFAALGIVNLSSFRQLAFLLAAGVLIDSFFVRSLLVPALVALFGRTHTQESEQVRATAAARAGESLATETPMSTENAAPPASIDERGAS